MGDGVFEDIGYRRPEDMERETYPQTVRYVEKKRIKLLSGEYRGEIRLYRKDIADELINNGKAEEVKGAA